jgi:hypothetical protein
MAKATLTFNLPEETDEHKLALRGGDYFCVIMDCKNAIRSFHKYMEPKKIKELVENLENILNEAKVEDIS